MLALAVGSCRVRQAVLWLREFDPTTFRPSFLRTIVPEDIPASATLIE